MYEQHLTLLGLSQDQALMYETLVRSGPLHASAAARRANIPRTLAYAVLRQLETMELIKKKDAKGSIATFSSAHPLKLQELARLKQKALQDASTSLDSVLATLISDFNKTSGEPGIRILGGIDGVRELYADVLKQREDIYLIRSPNDAKFPELKSLVEKQISDQVRLGIRSHVITPLRQGSIKEMLSEDRKYLRERRIITDKKFSPPSQILIYGNKVATTAYNEEIITTVIENKDICGTWRLIFNYMWSAARLAHESLVNRAIS